ncbi:MAG: hypothetical protein Q8K59_01990 [Nitrosomonas sp.]|nr:hypothetical protein [Nitrosomonas sp.]
MRLPRVRKSLDALTRHGLAAHEASRWLCDFGVVGLVLLAAVVMERVYGGDRNYGLRASTG